MIKVLHIVPNMHAAGLETLIMNLYRNIDRSKVQFCFLTHYKGHYFYDDEIVQLGGKIYRLSFRNDKNFIKYLFDLNRFFKNHKFDVVHCHMASTALFTLFFAKLYGAKVRILHSHNTSTEKTIKGYIKSLLLKLSLFFCNYRVACGKDSGKFLFNNRKFFVIHNAIDINKFLPNLNTRKKVRNSLNIQNDFVLGHIGRFSYQKNHDFLIEVVKKYRKVNPSVCLLLIGEGELEERIRDKVKSEHLENNVRFLGVRNDTCDIYQSLDVFLLPSHFEGLPVVGIESQVSGTNTIFSDKVTREVKFTDNVQFLPLNIDAWVENLKKIELRKDECVNVELLKNQIMISGYDIRTESIRVFNLYKKFLKEQNW